jgi:hypothetical protein
MKYVTAMGTVWKFSNSEFKRQMEMVANGGEFDFTKSKEVAQEMIKLDDIDPEYAEEWLNPTPAKTAAEQDDFVKQMAEQYRAKQLAGVY